MKRALVAVERNNHGSGVLAHLNVLGVWKSVREGWPAGLVDIGSEPSSDDREYGSGVDCESRSCFIVRVCWKSAGHLCGIRMETQLRLTARMMIA